MPPGFKPGPTPERFFQIINAFQQAAALSAGIELSFFTAIAEGHDTAEKLATLTGTAVRGARILADYLTILGFLEKRDTTYVLADDASLFLNKNSPAYLGGAVEFIHSDSLRENFDALTDRVRAARAGRLDVELLQYLH